MNKENASKLWKIIQEAGDYLVGQLPDHPNHPKGRNPYAHVAICVKSKFNASYKDIPDEKYNDNELSGLIKRLAQTCYNAGFPGEDGFTGNNLSNKEIAKITDYILESESGDEIQIACYDYHDDYKYHDHFRIALRTYEYKIWLYEEAYKK